MGDKGTRKEETQRRNAGKEKRKIKEEEKRKQHRMERRTDKKGSGLKLLCICVGYTE